MVSFRSAVTATGGATTGIPVPDDALAALGAGRRPAVVATVNGYEYRTTPGARGGATLLPFSAEHRAASGLAAGDEVEVHLTLDATPGVLEVPADLARAIADAGLGDAWDGLPPSHRKEHVRAVLEAKKPETRARRVEGALVKLRAR
jgi:hypothetical protein